MKVEGAIKKPTFEMTFFFVEQFQIKRSLQAAL